MDLNSACISYNTDFTYKMVIIISIALVIVHKLMMAALPASFKTVSVCVCVYVILHPEEKCVIIIVYRRQRRKVRTRNMLKVN